MPTPGVHLDGEGARLHRPGQALDDGGAHRHEPLPQRGRGPSGIYTHACIHSCLDFSQFSCRSLDLSHFACRSLKNLASCALVANGKRVRLQMAFLDGNQPERLCAPMVNHITRQGGEVSSLHLSSLHLKHRTRYPKPNTRNPRPHHPPGRRGVLPIPVLPTPVLSTPVLPTPESQSQIFETEYTKSDATSPSRVARFPSHTFISHKVFEESFCRRQLLHKSVNLSFCFC